MILVYIELLVEEDLEKFMVAGKLTLEKCKICISFYTIALCNLQGGVSI